MVFSKLPLEEVAVEAVLRKFVPLELEVVYEIVTRALRRNLHLWYIPCGTLFWKNWQRRARR